MVEMNRFTRLCANETEAETNARGASDAELHRRSYFQDQRLLAALYSESTPALYDLGEMDCGCSACGAFHFKKELACVHTKVFTSCCQKIAVTLDPVVHNLYPDMLKTLYRGDHRQSGEFLWDIRKYNSAMAFASIVQD